MTNTVVPIFAFFFIYMSFTQYESHTITKLGDIQSKWNYAHKKFRTNIFDKFIYIYID